MLLAFGLTGCSGLYVAAGESQRRALEGIAVSADYIGASFDEVVATDPSVQMSPDALASVAAHVLVEPDAQTTAELRRGTTIYELDNEPDSVSISVFVATSATTGGGLTQESNALYACGSFTADRASGKTGLADLPCPDWLKAWNGDSAKETSMLAAVEKDGGSGAW
ncbi:hypothetical protein [Microbacterium sp.]|uniref:hypothetical protein n=1 Tax=Microbacterium sp. TaxID=51671 RepID=UPI003F95EECE